MDIANVLDNDFGFIHVDTIHISKDICMKTFMLSNRKVYSPLPSFDIIVLDKVITRQETEKVSIDWVLTKTDQSKRCILICLIRPRALSLTSVLSLMDYSPRKDTSSLVKIPQDPISRAVIESLCGQDGGFNVLVQEQVVSDEEVFTHYCIQVEDIGKRRSFAIDGKKWVTSLRRTITELGLIPSNAEIVDIPISQVMSGYREWYEFMLFLKMRRRRGNAHKIVEIPKIITKVKIPSQGIGQTSQERPQYDRETLSNIRETPQDQQVRDRDILQNHESMIKDSDLDAKGTGTDPQNKLEAISQGPPPSTSNLDTENSTSDNGQHMQGPQQRQGHRNPGWRAWVQGIALGIVFGTVPMWHLMSEF